ILTALDSFGRARVVVERKAPTGLGARHGAPGAVTAALKALFVAEPAHDVRARAHTAGNDPQVARSGAYRALSRDEDPRSEMVFHRNVIMMAVDDLFGRTERRQPAASLQRTDYILHHELAVGHGKILCPMNRPNVIDEMLGALGKIAEVFVG